MLPVYRLETASPGGEDNGILAVLGGDKHSAQMDDSDGLFDLDNLDTPRISEPQPTTRLTKLLS